MIHKRAVVHSKSYAFEIMSHVCLLEADRTLGNQKSSQVHRKNTLADMSEVESARLSASLGFICMTGKKCKTKLTKVTRN